MAAGGEVVLESVALGVLAALGWGIADFSVSIVSRRIGIITAAFGVHFAAVAATTIYLLAADDIGRLTLNHWGLLVGLGVLALVTYLSFYRALQLGPIAIISPIAGTYAMVVILLAAIVIGERLNALQILGTVASIGGVALASLDFRNISNGHKLIGAGVIFAVTATIGLGVWQYSLGILSREIGWFLPIYVSRLITLAFLTPLLLRRNVWKFQHLTLSAVMILVAAGLLESGGLFAFARGAEVGVISIVAAASTIYPVLPVLGGLLVFRERLIPSQTLGIVIVIAGLVILALSS